MKHVHKSVLLWHSPRQMYALVTGVADYPKFLPWCERAEVLSHEPGQMLARLHLHFAGVRQSFTTRNVHVEGESVQLELVDGPFSALQGHWRFVPLGGEGAKQGPDAPACRVEFDLRYAFASRPLALVVSPVFDRIAGTFVDAFVKRAEQVYGGQGG